MFSEDLGNGAKLMLLEERHAPDVFNLVNINRDHLREWLPWVDGTKSLDDSRNFIRSSLEEFARSDGFDAGIFQDDALAGLVGLFNVNLTGRAEIGYWLAENFTGRGLVTRACASVLEYAFEHRKLRRVIIRCGVGNDASCAVARRLGFTLEGVARDEGWLYDHYISHNIFSLLEPEWRERTKR
jgi:ribosomal-protein-serine acetyltransferase